jgi:hypothetical protein
MGKDLSSHPSIGKTNKTKNNNASFQLYGNQYCPHLYQPKELIEYTAENKNSVSC